LHCAEIQLQLSCSILRTFLSGTGDWYVLALKIDFTPEANRADIEPGRCPWLAVMEHIIRTIGCCVAAIDEWLLTS
jgi:hypothetical protein